jgi:hypothetical protein
LASILVTVRGSIHRLRGRRNGMAGVHLASAKLTCGRLTSWCSFGPALMLRSMKWGDPAKGF